MFLDALEVVEGLPEMDPSEYQSELVLITINNYNFNNAYNFNNVIREDRYVSVRACLGNSLLKKLGAVKLFMVGVVNWYNHAHCLINYC